ncbi:MAG: hypothetical protein IT379_18040 [Deltaproteobacteria bacterium]|nr:hypothetical protein [Deltaproteobacteria bacterium]
MPVVFFHPDGTCNSFTAEHSETLRVFSAFVANTDGSLMDSCTWFVDGDDLHRILREDMPIPGLPESVERVQRRECTDTELRWSDDTGSFVMLRAPDDFAAGVAQACAENDFVEVSY